jgi:hypothetical protein
VTVISALMASKLSRERPPFDAGPGVAQAHCNRVKVRIIKNFFMTPPWSGIAKYGDLLRICYIKRQAPGG